MNLEKEYLLKTAKLVSDTNITDHKGILCVNYNADKQIYFAIKDCKNQDRENQFLKRNVCQYCSEIYKNYAKSKDIRVAEFYTESAKFYAFASDQNMPAEELYSISQDIRKQSRRYEVVAEKPVELDSELTK